MNPVDFIAIETVRVFCPQVYDIVRRNPDSFAGSADTGGRGSPLTERLKPFHDKWLEEVDGKNRESIKKLFIRLFPKLEAVFGNKTYGNSWETQWRKNLRICSKDVFPVYFRLSVPEGDLSSTEMKSILELANNVELFGQKLVELSKQKCPDGTTRVRMFLERLEDFTEEDIPLDQIPCIVETFFMVGDELLILGEERGMFDFGNDLRIGRVIRQLFLRLEEYQRFGILKNAILKGRSLSIIDHEVAVLGQQHGMYKSQARPESERLITKEHLVALGEFYLGKIREAANNNSLSETPHLTGVLYRWKSWSGEDEVKEWVHQAVQNDSGLIEFLEKFLRMGFSHSESDMVEKRTYRLDPKQLEPFLEPASIYSRVKNLLLKNNLNENQKKALTQFVKEYEVREQGGNPDEDLE